MDVLRTPALVCDVAALDANIAAMQAVADAGGVALRPHAKGHRAPWIAERQVAAGAVGVAVATVGEAATMVGAGIADVLLTTAVSPARATEVVELAVKRGLTVVVHDAGLVRAFDLAAVAHGVTLPVLLDVDVGQRRGGVQTPEAAVVLAGAVARAPNLRLRGVQAYDGHLQSVAPAADRAAGHATAMARLDGVLDALGDDGHAVGVVTTAGTATAALAAEHPRVTELQPGSYALMDHRYATIEGVVFAQAAYVVTTVTAVLGPEEVIVDAGTRAVSVDLGPAGVAGLDAVYAGAGDEHGRVTGAVAHLRPGDPVALIPSHTDTTVVLHGEIVAGR